MKNKIIILMLAIGGLFASCSDAFEIQQKGEINNPYEAFRNAEDVARGLNTIYSSIPGETEIDFVSVFTDEVALGRDNGGQGIIRDRKSTRLNSSHVRISYAVFC